MVEQIASRMCWECSIHLNVDSQVAEILNNFSNEISTFNRQVKEINFPRPVNESCCQRWTIQSKMKLFDFSKCRDDIDSFLNGVLSKDSKRRIHFCLNLGMKSTRHWSMHKRETILFFP